MHKVLIVTCALAICCIAFSQSAHAGPTVADLISKLKSKDTTDQWKAAKELEKLGPKIRGAKADESDAVQVELLAKIRELIRASDALLEAAVKEGRGDE